MRESTVVRAAYETDIFFNQDGDVVIHQIGSGWDNETGESCDQVITIPVVSLPAVIARLQQLNGSNAPA